MRRFPLLAVPAAALLLLSVTPAPAQTSSPQPAPPLMTAPRSDDQRPTEPATSPPGVAGEAPSEELQRPAPPAGSSPPVAALPPGSLTAAQARDLIGKPVAGPDGKTVGKISNFVVNPQSGTPDRVVLWMDGRSEEVTAPLAALKTDSTTPVLEAATTDLQPIPSTGTTDLLMPRQE